MYLNDRWPEDLQNAWQTGRMGCLIFISVRMKPRYGMRWRPEELSADM